MVNHHQFGPSALDRLAACPKSLPGPSSEAAERGTAIHAVAAGTANPDTLDDDGRAEVQFWHDTIPAGNGNLIEHRLALLDDDFNEILFGTADCVVVGPDDVTVYDLKTGQKHDYPLQMMAYAAAAMQTFGRKQAWVKLVYSKLRTVEQAEYHDLPGMIQTIKAVIAVAQDESAPFCPGWPCGWCGRKLECPALAGTALAVAKGYSPPELKIKEWHSSAIIDPVEMAKALTVAKIVERWVDSVKEHALSMALTGGVLPGFELSERRGNATIIDPQEALTRSELPLDAFMPCVKVGYGAFVKAVAKQQNLSEAKVKKELDDWEGVIGRGEPTKSLRATKGNGNGLDE